MPIPAAISGMGNAAYAANQIDRTYRNPNPPASGGRQNLTRHYNVYLEVVMQAKHDSLMQGYCHRLGLTPRRRDGTQVRHGNSDALSVLRGFYEEKAAVAAGVVEDIMLQRWSPRGGQAPGSRIFVPGIRIDAGVQMQVQTDGYQYELSYWYDSQDIYVLYHCSPER